MTAQELKERMFDLANEKASAYEEKRHSLEKDKKIERKALSIQKEISENCAKFLQYHFDGRYHKVREQILFHCRPNDLFEPYRAEFCKLNEEDQALFLTFAYPMWMILHHFYLPRKEMLKKENAAEKIFESKLIIGTVGEILGEWQTLWNIHGSMKCEVFS